MDGCRSGLIPEQDVTAPNAQARGGQVMGKAYWLKADIRPRGASWTCLHGHATAQADPSPPLPRSPLLNPFWRVRRSIPAFPPPPLLAAGTVGRKAPGLFPLVGSTRWGAASSVRLDLFPAARVAVAGE
jgi:hypothetical protein